MMYYTVNSYKVYIKLIFDINDYHHCFKFSKFTSTPHFNKLRGLEKEVGED